MAMPRTTLAIAASLVLAHCGVDRLDADSSVVRILLALDAPPSGTGGAVRDARGRFDLAAVGVFVAVTVDAEDMEEPVTADWPDTSLEEIPDQAELTLMLPAGPERTFEGLALVLDASRGLEAYSGTTTQDLSGGTEMDVDLELEPLEAASVTETVELPASVEAGNVHTLHPVDVEHEILYPPAVFLPGEGVLEVSSTVLPRGRSVYWTILTASEEWVDTGQETHVP
jgi:hypothetical protein